jgi:hypothetical protein
MNNKVNLYKKIGMSLALLFLLCNLLLLCWYLFIGYQVSFHSDSAIKVLLAREVVKTGQYFPHDWVYGNGEIWVLCGQTFIIPLLAFFPAGFFVHAISGLVSSALILSGVWFLTGLFEIGKIKRVTIVAILAAGISAWMSENLYGQVSYGYGVYGICYIIYFAWAFLTSIGRRKILFGVSLFLILLLVFWATPQKTAIFLGLPLLLAVAHYMISDVALSAYSSRERRVGYHLIAIMFLSAAVGTAFHSITLLGVNNVLGLSNPRWLSYDEMVRNATVTLQGFFALFGGLPSPGGILASKSGIYEAIRFISALALLVLMPLSLRRALQQKARGPQFVASFTLVSVLLILFIELATFVPGANGDPITKSRYLVPSLVLLLIIVLAQNYKFTKTPFLALMSAIVSITFITSAYSAFGLSNYYSKMNGGISAQQHNPLENLKDFLLANGLRYGYASYWHAGVLSVLSDEKVLVRPVGFDRGLPMPMRFTSSNRWYRPSAWQGETFLLLTEQEVHMIRWDHLGCYHAKPVRELHFEEFTIFVFAQNLAKILPGWDSGYQEPVSFPASTYSLTQIGRFYDNYENTGSALVAEKGEVGWLHFGPYIDVEPGTYTASFDVTVESTSNPSAWLDVATAYPGASFELASQPAFHGSGQSDVANVPGQKILAKTVLTDNTSVRRLRFTLDKMTTLEFRVWSLGNARVVFRNMSIVRNDLNKE